MRVSRKSGMDGIGEHRGPRAARRHWLIVRAVPVTVALLLLAGFSLTLRPERLKQARTGEQLASVQTPDRAIDLALERAKASLQEGFLCEPDLGCGLVAQQRSPSQHTSPSPDRVLTGDASLHVFDLLTYGDFDLARDALDFLRHHQREDGKIPHQIHRAGAGGPSQRIEADHSAYDYAEATPLWVAALYEYWLQTADTAFVRKSWSAVHDAYRWVLANDSDGDFIVDNTPGGASHAFVTGPTEGVHQDIHLAAVSVESFRAVSDLAAAIGNLRLAQEAAQNFERAWSALERGYFLRDVGMYAFAAFRDGRTDRSISAWPATALSFSLLDNRRVERTLDALASHRLSTSSASRVLATDDRDSSSGRAAPFPASPLLTGFAAWGAYNYHRPHGGFTSLWAKALTTLATAEGYDPEDNSVESRQPVDEREGRRVPPGTHFPSSSILASTLFRGLFGLRADAPRNSLTLAPHLPAHWDSCAIRSYRVGSSQLDMEIRREIDNDSGRVDDARVEEKANAVLRATFIRSGGGPALRLRFAPGLPPRSRVIRVTVNGTPVDFERKLYADDIHVITTVTLEKSAIVQIEYDAGTGVVPVRPELADATDGAPRVIRYRADEGEYVLRVEGRSGEAHEMDLISPRGAPWQLSEGRLQPAGPRRFKLTVRFDSSADKYVEKEIRFRDP